jgi:transposase
MEPEETYSPAEAAKILRVSKRQILNYLNAGELEGELRRTPYMRSSQNSSSRHLGE